MEENILEYKRIRTHVITHFPEKYYPVYQLFDGKTINAINSNKYRFVTYNPVMKDRIKNVTFPKGVALVPDINLPDGILILSNFKEITGDSIVWIEQTVKNERI